jgi:Methyltransferase domain
MRFRRRRMARFYATFQPSGQTRVLDIGGAPNTWFTESGGNGAFPVTLINLQYPDRHMLTGSRFTIVEGDAIRLPFPDASFDIAFSNSVIEHMTTWERQQAFAAEARRVARSLWIQTPARSFPVEQHLLTPWFQYVPRRLQPRLARRFTVWGWLTRPSPAEVDEMLSDIRLLTRRELQILFPDCHILRERFCGLTKSYIAVRGIPPGFRPHGRAPQMPGHELIP